MLLPHVLAYMYNVQLYILEYTLTLINSASGSIALSLNLLPAQNKMKKFLHLKKTGIKVTQC